MKQSGNDKRSVHGQDAKVTDDTISPGAVSLDTVHAPVGCDHEYWFTCKCGKPICNKCGKHYDGRSGG
jgi:hypothetical protein